MPATSAPANGACYSYPISPTATKLLEQRHKCLRNTETPPIPGKLRPSTLTLRAKPLWDSAPPPTLPATPAVIMEVADEGHTITAEEFQAEHWTPVLYKAYASRPASSQKPLPYPNATFEAADANARNAAHDAAAATGSGTTPARLPPATKETRITVKRSKQLPPLPPNAIRVIVRPRGELRLRDIPTPRLTKAVQAELQITLPDDFCLRIHPTSNTFTAVTTHSSTAEVLKTLTSLTIGDHTYPCVAYVAAPPGATRGVISNAFYDETPTQLYQDLVIRNPEYAILAARRMGKTHSILITFDANEVPHSIKYMGAIHRCTPYRGSPDACTNCRQPGHRYDVCPNPKSNLCPRCGTQHLPQEPPCTPKCILCEDSHLTGTGSCKGRNLHQPRKQIKQPETQQQEPHASFLTATPTLQDALAKSREEAAAAKAEAQAARAEAAALREHIAKLEAQYSCHKLSKPTYPRSNCITASSSQSTHSPYHSQPHLTPSKRKKPKAAEGQDSPIPAVAHDSHPGAAAVPIIDSHDGNSKP
ncbi:hypothetical protein HPB52_009297 [Rhipicephalus sanguineus]|uniref:CCHC-type domain-containing protein n=1 Tax=Rhipicephalus sanguineus TaxID=34632 RepID=A0A9D4PQW2_RHISA|nr:hypothetical protein HPB52_009297 [Rhipicephalus sanguineus]